MGPSRFSGCLSALITPGSMTRIDEAVHLEFFLQAKGY
jgi:hypothetical protein